MWVVPLLAVLAAGPGQVPDAALARPVAGPTPHAEWAVPLALTAGRIPDTPGEAGTARPQQAEPTPADAPPIGESLQRLAAVIGTSDGPAPARFSDWPATLREARQRAARALTTLLELSKGWPAATPEPYRRQLAGTATLVERAANDAGPTPLTTLIGPLADDLETKLGHCQASGGRLGRLIAVRVRTVQGSREAPDWQVLILPRLFAAAPGAAPTPFARLSSPTVEQLVPGRYLLWARDPARGRVSERQVLVVGDGRDALDIDLPVPADGG